MRDDPLRDLLRTLEDGPGPDPSFAEALYARLSTITTRRRTSRLTLVLLAATLLVLVAAGAIVGSQWPRLPVTVEASPGATPAATPAMSATASRSPASTLTPEPERALTGRVIAVAAPKISLRSEPDGEELHVLRTGQRMRVADGPVVVGGMEWFEIRIGPGNLRGWVPAGANRDSLVLVEDGVIAASCAGNACPDGSGVYLATLEDGLGTKLADEPMWVGVWSPDGTRLAVTDAGASAGTVVLLGPDGAPLGERLRVDALPEWSPDGSRLAWSTGASLLVADADLVPQELVRMDATVRRPAWSPDGTQLAFVQRPCPECDQSGRPRPAGTVWIVGADGANLRSLGRASTDSITWSPDGRYLALSEYAGAAAAGADLSLLPVDDLGQTSAIAEDLVPGWAFWSPDGTRLAYTTDEGLVVADGDGSDARLLVPLLESAATIPQLRWAPSGRSLLVESVSESGGVSIHVVDVETGESRDVLPGAPYLVVLQWQPVLAPLP